MQSGYVYIADCIFPTLLAISEEEQEKGLMHTEWPPPVMSFVYLSPSNHKFWMKNTPSPLDIIFTLNGKINQIHKGEPNSTNIIGDKKLSDLIIELPFGTADSFNFKINNSVGLFKPTINELKEIILKKQARNY